MRAPDVTSGLERPAGWCAAAEHPHTQQTGDGEAGSLRVDDYFAIVPDRVLDAPISDCALRLYAGTAEVRAQLRRADARASDAPISPSVTRRLIAEFAARRDPLSPVPQLHGLTDRGCAFSGCIFHG